MFDCKRASESRRYPTERRQVIAEMIEEKARASVAELSEIVPYATLHFLTVVGGGALFAYPVEAALLGAPEHPDAEDIRAQAEAVADVLISGIALSPPSGSSTLVSRAMA